MQNISLSDIIFTPYPYSDFTELKNRPVLVISKNNNKDVIIVKITSVIKNSDFNYLINPKKINFVLLKESQIILNSISTIDKNLILKKIGRIFDDELDLILNKIKANLTR